MAPLSDKQVDLILSRIVKDGVTELDLQNGLLDHYCCFIEAAMQQGQGFEEAYQSAFQAITPGGMHEIQEELFFLLTFKKQTTMKKIVLGSGTLSAALLSAGIAFKYMHWAGANVLIGLGMLFALLFIPLLLVMKVKTTQKPVEKLIMVLGSLSAISLLLGVFFKIEHWPYANMLGVTAPAILIILFLPLNLFYGLRNEATRTNAIVTSIMTVMGCCLFFALTITPGTVALVNVRGTKSYLRFEQILQSEQKAVASTLPASQLSQTIYNNCEELKAMLIQHETGSKTITPDFEEKGIFIGDHWAQDYIENNQAATKKLNELVAAVNQYNTASATVPDVHMTPLPTTANIIDPTSNRVMYKVLGALNDLVQIQLMVLQNEKNIAATTGNITPALTSR